MFFSIIITTCNAEPYVLDALNSLKNQTVQDFEWIITDDCSTDQTLEICKTWLAENPEFLSRAKIIRSPVNTGVSANTNRGLKAASGKWIQVLSADDALMKDALEQAKNFMEKNPDIAIFQGLASIYNNDFSEENFVETISCHNQTSVFFNLSADGQYKQLLRKNPVVGPAVFYKKNSIEKMGFCDERIPLIDDWPLWLKFTKQGDKIHFCNHVLAKYRQHDQSITNENKGLFVSDLHRKNRLVYRLYIAPNIGFFRKINYHLNYAFDEFLYRFFNSKNNLLALYTLHFLRFIKHRFVPQKVAKNPKHVAFFMQDFETGGVGTVFLNYSKILKPLGYEIDLIIARDSGALYEHFKDHVHIINLGNIRQRYAIFKLRKQIKYSSVSTLISGSELANIIAILSTFGLRKSCKLIITQHGLTGTKDDLDLGFIKYNLLKLAKRMLYRKAAHIIAVSQAVADDLKDRHLPKEKINFLPNPVFHERIKALSDAFKPADSPEKYIVFVGRLVDIKNVDLLLDAFMQIEDNSLHLVILGDGYNRKRLEEKAKPVQSRVHFLGVKTNPMPYIKYAKIVAIPSFTEAMPMVAIESCVLGKTVVHTPNTGCLEVFSLYGSYCTTRFDDPKEFSEALKTALNKPIEPMILKQRAHIFDAAQIAPKLEQLIQNK